MSTVFFTLFTSPPFVFTWFKELTAGRLDNLMIWVATDHNWRRPSKSIERQVISKRKIHLEFDLNSLLLFVFFIHSLVPLFYALPPFRENKASEASRLARN